MLHAGTPGSSDSLRGEGVKRRGDRDLREAQVWVLVDHVFEGYSWMGPLLHARLVYPALLFNPDLWIQALLYSFL